MDWLKNTAIWAGASRRLAVLVMLAVLVGIAAVAHAHDLPQERTILVQIGPDRVEVMLVFLEPPGSRTDLLLERFDLNRDGELRGGEAQLAGSEWVGRVLKGLQFEVVGEKPKAHAPEIKFRRERKGALSAAVYARWDLEPLGAEQARTLHVRLLDRPDNVATEVAFQASPPLTLTTSELPPRLGSRPDRPVLTAGEQATVRVQRARPPLPATSE